MTPGSTGSRWSWAAVLAVGAVLAMRGAWSDILQIARVDEEASHVWLVPFLVGWLVYLRREKLASLRPAGHWVGPLMVAVGWGVAHLGFYHSKQSPWHLGAVVILLGCVVSVIGTDMLRQFWPAVLLLGFLVPVPATARQQIAIPLQNITARATAACLNGLGANVVRFQNSLTINGKPVEIAEACNGMRMVFPLLLICCVFVFMLPLKRWLQVGIVLISPLVAIGCNVLRLIPTVWLFGNASKARAEQFHDVSGWLMLPLALGLLFGALRLLRIFGVTVLNGDGQTTRKMKHSSAAPEFELVNVH